MRIVVAPQAFKGTLRSAKVVSAISEGISKVFPSAEIIKVPMADGGDGTLDTLLTTLAGSVKRTTVTGPLGRPVRARWAMLDDGSAIIEMAQAAGLLHVPVSKRDPRITTTYGVGQLITAALDSGCTRLLLCIGGSSTNDGGAGMLQALGVQLQTRGLPLPPGGAAIADLDQIDIRGLDHRIKDILIEVATDVTNPLCGPNGATRVYGPQKGATPEIIEQLENAMEHYALMVANATHIPIRDMPGAGAAGGLGAALTAFLWANIRWGAEVVADTLSLDKHMAGADLVVTGEGRLDEQTGYHKAPLEVVNRATARDIPVLFLAGSLGTGYESTLNSNVELEACTTHEISQSALNRQAYGMLVDAAERAALRIAYR